MPVVVGFVIGAIDRAPACDVLLGGFAAGCMAAPADICIGLSGGICVGFITEDGWFEQPETSELAIATQTNTLKLRLSAQLTQPPCSSEFI